MCPGTKACSHRTGIPVGRQSILWHSISHLCQPARQSVINAIPVIDVLAKDYPHGSRVAEHRHKDDQLLYAFCGTMTVNTEDGTWVIPPQRSVWIPAGILHSICMSGAVKMRTLYLTSGRVFPEYKRCAVLSISALDRELILELVRTPASNRGRHWRMLASVLLERLTTLSVLPLHLPMPNDSRARRVSQAIIDRPACNDDLATLAKSHGVSPRTLARLFFRETGMTFGRWRQQARILASLSLLAAGQSVTSAALDVGYNSPSAFVAMFRRALGVSPGRYYMTEDKQLESSQKPGFLERPNL